MINKLFNIKYPLIQGGMANIATGRFAAVISNAGGLGLIGAGGMDTKTLKENIDECRKLTNQPFGVNIMLMNPHADEMAELMIKEKIQVITTGAGNPGKYMEKWIEAGIKVIPVVASVALAKRMERNKATAIIVEGSEAGGHIGDLTTMALVPQVIEAVNIPVIAAGGIASSSQVLAAFALGAQGIQIGTCLLASEECPIHDNYKNEILKASDTGTTVTGRINGTPVRIIKNKMAKEYIKREKSGATMEELEVYTLGALRKAVFNGDVKDGSLMSGQVSGMIKEIKPAKVIIESLFEDLLLKYQNLESKVITWK
jgi:Dioxygenases related to 2-nitropropane dioxygenase